MSNRRDGSVVLDAPAAQQWQSLGNVVELRFPGTLVIDNRWDYPAEVVEALRGVLCEGVAARPDPVRGSLYEVEKGASVYYIHVSPLSQRVMLLAVWNSAPRAQASRAGY